MKDSNKSTVIYNEETGEIALLKTADIGDEFAMLLAHTLNVKGLIEFVNSADDVDLNDKSYWISKESFFRKTLNWIEVGELENE